VTTRFDSLLGLPVDRVRAALQSRGIDPAIQITAPPGNPHKTGTLRVIAVREDGQLLIAAAFNDAAPDMSGASWSG
jgi:hypothetical protein